MSASKKDFSRSAERFFTAAVSNTTNTTDTANTTNTMNTADTTSTMSTTNTADTTDTISADNRRNKAHGNYARMSIGLSPDVMQYLRLMASICNTSVAGYIERIARTDMQQHGSVYERAKGLQDDIQRKP